jgi:pimeloyl-ACP methyl ester carboxylesterase
MKMRGRGEKMMPERSLARRTVFGLIVIILSLLATVSVAFSQTEVEIQSFNISRFEFLYGNVSVNSYGAPVTDLTKEDFEVYEDGVLQTDYFEVTPPAIGDNVRLADIVILIDVSGSMGQEIADVRNNVNNFANALSVSNIDFRLGLVRFGSTYGPNPLLFNDGNLTNDVPLFQSFVDTLRAYGSYEPGFLAIRQAITGFNFRPGAQKIFIIITDEDSDDRNKATTIDMLLANSVTVHAAVNCSSGNSRTDYCDDSSVRGVTDGLLFGVSDSYNQILDTIVETARDTYVVRYKTNNPTIDGNVREVEIFATANGLTDSDIITYIPGSEPKIELTSETQELRYEAQIERADLTITVKITDSVAPTTTAAKLFYKPKTGSTFQFVNLTNTEGEVWSGIIPGDTAVLTPGVEFYITATDGQQSVSLPKTDPSVKPFNIAVLPNEKPVIDHTPRFSAVAGFPINIEAEISDTTYGLDTVQLFYRQKGEITYTEIGETVGLQTYNFVLTIPTITGDASSNIEYYIVATDDLGISAYAGSPENPLEISILPESALEPKNTTISTGVKRAYLSWETDYYDSELFFKIEARRTGTGEVFEPIKNPSPIDGEDEYKFSGNEVAIENLDVPDVTYKFRVVSVYNGQIVKTGEPVEAKVYKEGDDENRIVRHSPILLIPGTGGKASAWDSMTKHLEDFGLVFGDELWVDDDPDFSGDFYTCNYPDPTGSIGGNDEPTKLFIDKIREVRDDKQKVTLVGQSLGGLRARTYVQSREYQEEVAKQEQVAENVERLIMIGSPNLGVLDDASDYSLDVDNDGTIDIYGVWRTILGDADESTDDFFDFKLVNWLTFFDVRMLGFEYKFKGGYVNDPTRYGLKENEAEKISYVHKAAIVSIMKILRKKWGSFTGKALLEDVIADSPFMKEINCWSNEDCSFSSIYNAPPESLDYRYVIGVVQDVPYDYKLSLFNEGIDLVINAPWNLDKYKIGGIINEIFIWLNKFMFKGSAGDGFISAKSQMNSQHTGDRVKTIPRAGENHLSELKDYIGLFDALDVPIIKFLAKCPVDIQIESPSGLIQSRIRADILGAEYSEADVNDDGEMDKFIEIPLPEQGEYKIFLTPKEDAAPDATYTLEVEQGGVVTVLKENAPVSALDGTPEVYFVNAEPIADAGPDQTVEADASGYASVTLDGSASSDKGSTPGTNDDIVQYEWFENGSLLATGKTAQVSLGVGEHDLTLIVTDKLGVADDNRLFVTVTESEAIVGDLDGDGDVDRDDLNIILYYRNQPASLCPECDLDGDGMVTGLDSRQLVVICTRPRCATE